MTAIKDILALGTLHAPFLLAGLWQWAASSAKTTLPRGMLRLSAVQHLAITMS